MVPHDKIHAQLKNKDSNLTASFANYFTGANVNSCNAKFCLTLNGGNAYRVKISFQ